MPEVVLVASRVRAHLHAAELVENKTLPVAPDPFLAEQRRPSGSEFDPERDRRQQRQRHGQAEQDARKDRSSASTTGSAVAKCRRLTGAGLRAHTTAALRPEAVGRIGGGTTARASRGRSWCVNGLFGGARAFRAALDSSHHGGMGGGVVGGNRRRMKVRS